MFYSFCWWLCMIWIRVMYHVEIVGRENVPRDRGYILAANHRTNMDPIFVAAGVRAPIRYMAKVELFQKGKLFSWLLHRLGAFPVERGKGDTGAVEWAEQVVRSGAVLGMFPEGTRSKDGTPGDDRFTDERFCAAMRRMLWERTALSYTAHHPLRPADSV